VLPGPALWTGNPTPWCTSPRRSAGCPAARTVSANGSPGLGGRSRVRRYEHAGAPCCSGPPPAIPPARRSTFRHHATGEFLDVQHAAGELLHVQALAKLRGNNDLPQPWIASLLPVVQAWCYFQFLRSFIEAGLALSGPVCSAFQRKIFPVSLPLSGGPVPDVTNSNGATLPIWPCRMPDAGHPTRLFTGHNHRCDPMGAGPTLVVRPPDPDLFLLMSQWRKWARATLRSVFVGWRT
jgi:hypothetical protein